MATGSNDSGKSLNEVKTLSKSEWPTRPVTKRRKRDRDFDDRVDSLLAKRNSVANGLGIDGSLIASRAVIESIAANEASPHDLLMGWQRELLEL